jgi:hypothetical protein
MNEIIRKFTKDERYTALLEEFMSIVRAKQDERTFSLIEEKYAIGQAMIAFIEENHYHPTEVVNEVAKDIGVTDRTVWKIYGVVKEMPDAEQFKVAYRSWSEGAQKLLGEPTEPQFSAEKVAQGLIRKYGTENAHKIAGLILARV